MRLSGRQALFQIRIHWYRMRHFRRNGEYHQCFEFRFIGSGSENPETENRSISRVLMTKNWEKLQLKKNFIFFYQKLQFTYPLASIKDVQATGEAFSPQKRTSSTSKHEISFLYFSGNFYPPGCGSGSQIRIRTRSTGLIESGSWSETQHIPRYPTSNIT
jgi:hypothetical protein